jgi:hypothetical protein
MFRISSLATALLLISTLDVPWVYPLRPQPVLPGQMALPALVYPPDIFLAIVEQSTKKSAELQPASRLDLVRYVDGEYAKVVLPIPSEKHGFRFKPGQPVDPKQLHQALIHGSAANPGDQIQITNIDFRAKEIVISINGGTKTRFNWKQHLQISMGPMPSSQTVAGRSNAAPIGAELILDFGGAVPDLSADDLKRDLSPFLDFSGQHSAAVNWVDTLPPKFQQSIKEHKAIEGMNHDMVMAAMGRPDQKFRERDLNGKETEDWIYGHPPSKTTQVTFAGDAVVRVQEYN